MGGAVIDWQAIKTEYITTDTSYRKLAVKYGVNYTCIGDRSRKEDWIGQRERWQSESLSKTLEAVSSAQAERAARLQGVAEKLLGRIEETVEAMDGEHVSAKAFRDLAGALKDLKDIQMIKSEADIREQEARIDNLRRQADKDDKSGASLEITVDGIPSEWVG